MKEKKNVLVFQNIDEIKKLERYWDEQSLIDFLHFLEKNNFQESLEEIYFDGLEFIKRNEDIYFVKTLNTLLLWEFLIKIRIMKAYEFTSSNPEKGIPQYQVDQLVFNMANVNNFRITLVNNITDWIISRFEYANENYLKYPKLAESEVNKIGKLSSMFKKEFKTYFNLKDEMQKNTFEDISFTIDKAIEIGNNLFEKSPKGKKFPRI